MAEEKSQKNSVVASAPVAPETAKNPAVEVAARVATAESDYVILSTGVPARVVTVSASLVDSAVSLVKDPPVPKFLNEDKGREEDNPLDPAYLAACKEAEGRRVTAAIDAMIMFGVELADGLPEDDTWLKKLQFLERHGQLDLTGYDPEEPLDREFLYKKYVAVGSQDLILIGEKAGLRPQDVADQLKSFPGQQTRTAD